MIKIAYVIDYLAAANGGTEGQLLALLKNLDRREFEPHLVYFRESPLTKDIGFELQKHKFDVKSVNSPRFLLEIWKFANICRKLKFDIVQTFFVDANIFGTIGATIGGCRNIISSRRNIGHWHNRKFVVVLRWLQNWTDYYLANSSATADLTISVEHVNPKKVKVIYNGLNLARFGKIDSELRSEQRKIWNIADDELLIGTVAHLREIKNIDLLIKSAAKLSSRFSKLRFVVVGEGLDRRRLENLIKELGLTNRFLLAGDYLNIVPCLAAFDIAVLTSKAESFSNSLIEYMAAGLPIIATNVGGNPEAITHGKSGFLFPNDDEKMFTELLKSLIENGSLAREMGRNAKDEAFNKYDMKSCIANHAEFYSTISWKRE